MFKVYLWNLSSMLFGIMRESLFELFIFTAKTWAIDHLRLTTTCPKRPLFWRPVFYIQSTKEPPNNNHLSTTAPKVVVVLRFDSLTVVIIKASLLINYFQNVNVLLCDFTFYSIINMNATTLFCHIQTSRWTSNEAVVIINAVFSYLSTWMDSSYF